MGIKSCGHKKLTVPASIPSELEEALEDFIDSFWSQNVLIALLSVVVLGVLLTSILAVFNSDPSPVEIVEVLDLEAGREHGQTVEHSTAPEPIPERKRREPEQILPMPVRRSREPPRSIPSRLEVRPLRDFDGSSPSLTDTAAIPLLEVRQPEGSRPKPRSGSRG